MLKKLTSLIVLMLISAPCFAEYTIEYDRSSNTLTKREIIEIKYNAADVLRDQQEKEEIEAIERALERRERYKNAENLYRMEVK